MRMARSGRSGKSGPHSASGHEVHRRHAEIRSVIGMGEPSTVADLADCRALTASSDTVPSRCSLIFAGHSYAKLHAKLPKWVTAAGLVSLRWLHGPGPWPPTCMPGRGAAASGQGASRTGKSSSSTMRHRSACRVFPRPGRVARSCPAGHPVRRGGFFEGTGRLAPRQTISRCVHASIATI